MVRCPTEVELERFLAGECSAADGAAIDRHRGDCPTCSAWLAEAASDEELLGDVRHALTDAAETASELTRALGELERYRILGRVGRGGMGIVYEAEQVNPRRRVALKVLRSGPLERDALQRFRYESEVLGRLDHPGVARIIEAGTISTTAGAQPFFAMELVEGLPLTEHARKLGVRARLELFAAVCRAVQHAHQKGVVHRDLKPDNILVTAAGQPKVLDFGIARSLEADATADARTRAGQLVGTLPYMSPEQVAGDPDRIDARADVYALGVLLFELLTGELPRDVRGLALPEAVRRIAEEPPRALGALDPSLRGDLETICATALEADLERRYDSASALLADVERHLRHEPIRARLPSRAYLARKFVRRHRALVAVLAALALALVGGTAATAVQAVRAGRAEREARRSATHATAALEFLSGLFLPDAGPLLGATPSGKTVREALDEAALRLEERPVEDPEVEAVVRTILGKAFLGLALLDEAEPHLRRVLELQEERADPRALNEAVTTLGALALAKGDLEEATRLQRRSLELSRELGSETLETAIALTNLAGLEGRLGRYAEAEEACRASLELKRRLVGERDAGVANTLAHLAYLRAKQGDGDEAIELTRQALAIFEEALGEDHEHAASCRANLAQLLANRGDAEQGLPPARESLARLLERLEPDHPAVLDARRVLGDLLLRTGEPEEAAAEAAAAAAADRGKSGRERQLAKSLVLLGNARRALDDVAGARDAFEEVLAVARHAPGGAGEVQAAEEALAELAEGEER